MRALIIIACILAALCGPGRAIAQDASAIPEEPRRYVTFLPWMPTTEGIIGCWVWNVAENPGCDSPEEQTWAP